MPVVTFGIAVVSMVVGLVWRRPSMEPLGGKVNKEARYNGKMLSFAKLWHFRDQKVALLSGEG